MARCSVCGFQRLGCGDYPNGGGDRWTGRWPGLVEVEEGLATDLNDLAVKAATGVLAWNGQRWVANSDDDSIRPGDIPVRK